jgi:hypothetical protein
MAKIFRIKKKIFSKNGPCLVLTTPINWSMVKMVSKVSPGHLKFKFQRFFKEGFLLARNFETLCCNLYSNCTMQ